LAFFKQPLSTNFRRATLAHAFPLSQVKPKKSTVTTLAQITPTTKGFPELSKSGLSLSISDTNPERATHKIAQMPSMPRKISPSHFFEVRGFLAALLKERVRSYWDQARAAGRRTSPQLAVRWARPWRRNRAQDFAFQGSWMPPFV
jgi:hypothetical protein